MLKLSSILILSFASLFANSLYNNEHLIEGSMDAKVKFVVFSDPLCPFCMDFIPEIINFVKTNPKEFGLFYYHLPLTTIHPNSQTLIKAMMVAQKHGVQDAIYKVYEYQFDNTNEPREELLKKFNSSLNTHITLKQIDEKWVHDELNYDINMAHELLVEGTPTLFVNGELDRGKKYYRALVDEYKGKK